MIYQERTATMITLLMRYSLCISVILYRKMKVLLIDVYNYNKGGAETVCFNTGKLLEEHGHQVVYFDTNILVFLLDEKKSLDI